MDSSQPKRVDLLALGEMMLRSIDGVQHLAGSSTNVAAAVARSFGWPLPSDERYSVGMLSAVVADSLGQTIVKLAQSTGIDSSHIFPIASDGCGLVANVLYELSAPLGDALPATAGYFYRAHSPVATRLPELINWESVFRTARPKILFSDGICLGLARFAKASTSTATLLTDGFAQAASHDCEVAFDTNYRASLWKDAGGLQAAAAEYRKLLPFLGVLTGSLGHLRAILGRPDSDPSEFAAECLTDSTVVEELMQACCAQYPQLRIVCASIRQELTPSQHRWQVVLAHGGRLYFSKRYEMQVLDRPGIGDAMAAQTIAGALSAKPNWQVVTERAAAHGWLMSQVRGDVSPYTLEQIDRVWQGGSIETKR